MTGLYSGIILYILHKYLELYLIISVGNIIYNCLEEIFLYRAKKYFLSNAFLPHNECNRVYLFVLINYGEIIHACSKAFM